jgi:hypothetical protein
MGRKEAMIVTEARLPASVNQMDIDEIIVRQVYYCETCKGETHFSHPLEEVIYDDCTCKNTNPELIAWVVDGKGCMIVWDERPHRGEAGKG